MFRKQGRCPLGTERLREVVALAIFAAEFSEALKLLCGLHSFGDDIQAKIVSHRKNCSGNFHALTPLPIHAADKRTIDLECVQRETMEIAERGVSRSEVIDRQ